MFFQNLDYGKASQTYVYVKYVQAIKLVTLLVNVKSACKGLK